MFDVFFRILDVLLLCAKLLKFIRLFNVRLNFLL